MKFIRMQLGKSIDWKIKSVSVDGEGVYEPTYTLGENMSLYVMIPNEDSVQSVKRDINDYLLTEEIKEEEKENE